MKGVVVAGAAVGGPVVEVEVVGGAIVRLGTTIDTLPE